MGGARGGLGHLFAGLAVLVLGGTGALVAGGDALAAQGTGQAYLVDGVVGGPVTVLLDGREIAASARPKSVVGPLQLAAGLHVVALRTGTRTVTSARFDVVAGRSIDLVAHRVADAAQTVRVVVFRNDLAPVGPGKARLVVAHAATAPPADIRLAGRVLFHDVAPGEALSLLVPAKEYAVDVVASGGSDTILGPVRLGVKPGTLTRVFAVGDPSNGTADAVVQTLPVPVVGAGRPRSVPTGDGGQAADSYVGEAPSLVPYVAAAGILAVLALARVRGRRLARARRHGR